MIYNTRLTYMFNLSITWGRFPKKMQIAKVSVPSKKGDKDEMSNYKPISILPGFLFLVIFLKSIGIISYQVFFVFCDF